jgi:predicted choloylglycine hydrolase
MTDKSVTSHEKLNTNHPALIAEKSWNPKTKKSLTDLTLNFSFSL